MASSRPRIFRSNSRSMASRSPGTRPDRSAKTCRAQRAHSTEHAGRRRGSRLSRGWYRGRGGRWWTTPRGRCSTPQNFVSPKAKRARGHGSWSGPRASARTGTSSATATTIARRSSDYVSVAGRIPLPPRFAFGAWWSRYWDYSDQEIEEIIRGFHENSTPLDVFVIDMGWHISQEQLKAMGEGDKNGNDGRT